MTPGSLMRHIKSQHPLSIRNKHFKLFIIIFIYCSTKLLPNTYITTLNKSKLCLSLEYFVECRYLGKDGLVHNVGSTSYYFARHMWLHSHM